jgi:hypothetical protein
LESPLWFIALLVLKSTIEGDSSADSLIDVQYRLLSADSPEGAYGRALQLGAAAEHDYLNGAGETVAWRFLGLRDLREILDGAPSDGAEVYSELTEAGDEIVVPKSQLTVFAMPT